jgi:hypothetical protein
MKHAQMYSSFGITVSIEGDSDCPQHVVSFEKFLNQSIKPSFSKKTQ